MHHIINVLANGHWTCQAFTVPKPQKPKSKAKRESPRVVEVQLRLTPTEMKQFNLLKQGDLLLLNRCRITNDNNDLIIKAREAQIVESEVLGIHPVNNVVTSIDEGASITS
jgi:hypothetical protein